MKRHGSGMVGKKPALTHEALVRWQAVVDLWDAIDAGYRANDENSDHAKFGFCWQTEGLRAVAKKLGVPLLTVMLLNDEITVEDLEQWDALPENERAAVLVAGRYTEETAEAERAQKGA